ncbi:MAG: hypothetical protein JSS30_03595 [Verrucomicrobia bacterium]|nr:hypothetical protein [Verrucomicrobiota bacterium]
MSKSVAANLFPDHPYNQYCERDRKIHRKNFRSAESWICAIGSAFPLAAIGARALQEAGVEQVATDYVTKMAIPGLLASAAFVVVGLAITRFNLLSIDMIPQMLPTNCLSKAQVKGWLSRMKEVAAIKQLEPKSAEWLNHLIKYFEGLDKEGSQYSQIYLPPAGRELVKNNLLAFEKFETDLKPVTKTKAELADLLQVISRCFSDLVDSTMANWNEKLNESYDRQDRDLFANGGMTETTMLLSAVMRANPTPGLVIEETEWSETLDLLDYDIQKVLDSVADEPSSVKIALNLPLTQLIEKFAAQLETKMDYFEKKELAIRAIKQLFVNVPVHEVSAKLNVPVSTLEQWNKIGREIVEKKEKELNGREATETEASLLLREIATKIAELPEPVVDDINNNNNVD